MMVDRFVEVLSARAGHGAWWGKPDPEAVAQTRLELKKLTGRELPVGLASFWSCCNGLVVGRHNARTPEGPVVSTNELPNLLDLADGEMILAADMDLLFEYVDGELPGHLVFLAIPQNDYLTLSLDDGAIYAVEISNFDDGPLLLAPSFEEFLLAWSAADFNAWKMVQQMRDTHPND